MPFPSSPKERDRPWVMRTYAGHSSPAESNALYRNNLSNCLLYTSDAADEL